MWTEEEQRKERKKEAKKYIIETLIPITVLFLLGLAILFSIAQLKWWEYVVSLIGLVLEVIFSYRAMKPVFYYVCGVYGNIKADMAMGLRSISRENQEKKVRNTQGSAGLALGLYSLLLLAILYNIIDPGKLLAATINSIALIAIFAAMWVLKPIYEHFYCLD